MKPVGDALSNALMGHDREGRSMAGREELCRDGLMTVIEAAGFLRLSRSNLYLMMKRGELPSISLGRSRRIPRRAVIALAARAVDAGYVNG